MKRKLNERDIPEVVEASKPLESSASPTFSSLGIDSRLVQAVNHEKFATPTLVQLQAIPAALKGQDLLVRSKTGSGKTLAYVLPLLHAILRRKPGKKVNRDTTALVLVPTKELATQVTGVIKTTATYSAQHVKCEDITRKEDANVTRARLGDQPDIVVATPALAMQYLNDEALKLDRLRHLVIDEADLILSYASKEHIQSIAKLLPSGVQKILMSATLNTETEALPPLLFPPSVTLPPKVIDLTREESAEKATLSQYTVRSAEDEKFLLIYAIFKLRLIKGKFIIFVADIDRCYRVKLFLEQFGIRSCVLNSELPVNSRLHVVQEFNRGVYDIIIAADEGDIVGNEDRQSNQTVKNDNDEENEHDDGEEATEEGAKQVTSKTVPGDDAAGAVTPPAPKRQRKSGKHARKDREYGVSRGIDFRHVTCVLNFDLPGTSKSYAHRIGRTARAGQSGTALSFYVPSELYRKHKPTSIPQCANDESVLAKIKAKQSKKGAEIKEWELDWGKLEGFRYRLADALRSVTRIAIREARARELREELIKSEKLKRHFEENPEDLRHLRHDTASHVVRQQAHLKHVPKYLMPSGGKEVASNEVGFVGMKRDKENRIRKARAFNKARGKGRIAKTKGSDPLKSLNIRGRGKK